MKFTINKFWSRRIKFWTKTTSRHVLKIFKENADIFADILLSSFNDSVEKSNFQGKYNACI